MSQISFNCTLIAHENVTTDFFCCCLGLFCFILFLFLFCVSSVWWFSLRLRTWVSVRMSCFFWRVFTLCLISDTTLRRWPSYQSQFHRRQTHGRSSGRTHWSEKALLYTKRVLWSPRVDNHHTHSFKRCVWYCTTLAKISSDVRECVWVYFVCVNFIFYWHGGVVGEALPASLVKLFGVVC